jgi:hypothetical protein
MYLLADRLDFHALERHRWEVHVRARKEAEFGTYPWLIYITARHKEVADCSTSAEFEPVGSGKR